MSDKFKELAKIWNEAENECLSAEAILNQVQDGELQAAIHLLRGWKLLGVLNARDRDDNSQLDRIDSFDALEAALYPATVVVLPEKQKAAWIDAVKSLFAFDPSIVASSPGPAGTPLENVNIIDASDDLCDALRTAWKRLKHKYGKTFRQRLNISASGMGAAVLAILLLLYIVPSLVTGFWNPLMWFKPRFGEFVISHAEQQWGTLRYDRSVDGKPLSIGSRHYRKGLGTHARSKIRLVIPGGYATFSGACGHDDETNGTITCRIEANGRVLFETGILRRGAPAQPFSVDIRGLDSVDLIVGDAGDGITADHADWVNLKLK